MQQESIYDQMTRPEKEVAEFLKNLGIKWCYEKPVFVWDENKRPRVWAPDFLRALHDHQLGGESPPSSITPFRRVVKDDPKGLTSSNKRGDGKPMNREVHG